MKKYDFAVVGNGIASMVAATELANSGNTVVMFNPSSNWGSYFSGINLGGRKFDLGMNLLEISSHDPRGDEVSSYLASVRNDVGRFCNIIGAYIGSLIEIVETEIPKCLYEGKVHPDMVLANRLDLLNSLSDQLKSAIIADLKNCLRDFSKDSTLHARNKLANFGKFASISYRDASVANHGAAFHRLFVEPACQRILAIASDSMSALLHRVAWLPLYYPETLISQFENGETMLPVTRFHYPKKGSFSEISATLFQRVQRNPGIDVSHAAITRISSVGTSWQFNGGICAAHLVWGQNRGQLSALLGVHDDSDNYTKISVHIAFATIDASSFVQRFSTIFILDSDSPIYRITDQTWAGGQFEAPQANCTIEMEAEFFSKWESEDNLILHSKIAAELFRIGIIVESGGLNIHSVRRFKDAIVSPTASNRCMAIAQYAKLNGEYPNIELIGPAAPFGATSFNDYIIQGLRLGNLHRKK